MEKFKADRKVTLELIEKLNPMVVVRIERELSAELVGLIEPLLST